MTVDRRRAERFLATRLGTPVSELTRLGHGEWSTAYAYNSRGRDYVIRFGVHPDDFERDRFAAAFASPALPVPAIVEIGQAYGMHYAISERLFGNYLDDLDEQQMRAVLPSLLATLDAVRLLDLSATTGYGIVETGGNAPFASWADFLLEIAVDRPGARVSGWRDSMAKSATGTATFDAALVQLRDLLPVIPRTRHLVHSDLLNFNVLAANDRISAVLDWGSALYGDFLYDIAWFVYWAPVYPAWHAIDFAGEAAKHYQAIGLDVPRFAERLQVCLLHIGLIDQVYNAFKQRWDRLENGAARTREIMAGIAD
jgi:hygromycin-B 4-O-kinase